MTIHQNADALKRDLIPAGTWGNVTVAVKKVSLAALAQNEKAAAARLPANCKVLSTRWGHDAMGATTGLQLGYETEDGAAADADAFDTVADSSSAGVHDPVFEPVELTKKSYLTVMQTGSGTATGDVWVAVAYQYTNA